MPNLRSLLPAIAFAALTPFALAASGTEIGQLNGAAFRIDVPEPWNGSLVIYCHGYSLVADQFKSGDPDSLEQVFLHAGFAVARSGYSAGGWAIQQAEIDTLSLKRYFASKYGRPKQVYITGHSMGGFLTMLLMERYPSEFAGGMPMCGPLQPALQLLKKAFDDQIVFTYYLPGLLPEPHSVPQDYKPGAAVAEEIVKKLQADPRALAALEHYSGLKDPKDIAGQAAFWTYIIKEIDQRAGGNPFDNRSTIYWNTGDDNALNLKIKRAAADPAAVDYLRAFYTPTGKLFRPMLAIHTTYDQLVSPLVPDSYFDLTQEAGSGDLFVQQFVEHDGHCAIQPAEIGAGFAELRAWVDSGKKPAGGPVPQQ